MLLGGDASYGGNHSTATYDINANAYTYVDISSELTSVTQIFSNGYAFAALKGNGSVVAWGNSAYGGNSSIATLDYNTYQYAFTDISSELTTVTQIFSTGNAFAALKGDGSVVTWGNSSYGGNSSNATLDKNTYQYA